MRLELARARLLRKLVSAMSSSRCRACRRWHPRLSPGERRESSTINMLHWLRTTTIQLKKNRLLFTIRGKSQSGNGVYVQEVLRDAFGLLHSRHTARPQVSREQAASCQARGKTIRILVPRHARIQHAACRRVAGATPQSMHGGLDLPFASDADLVAVVVRNPRLVKGGPKAARGERRAAVVQLRSEHVLSRLVNFGKSSVNAVEILGPAGGLPPS